MKKILSFLTVFIGAIVMAQNPDIDLGFEADSVAVDSAVVQYKKPVMDMPELEFLMSYYTQKGQNSAVGGGVGTEELVNATPTLILKYPLNSDDVLTVDLGLSAYTSASSSNINPTSSGASDDDHHADANPTVTSPWVESSGESSADVLASGLVNYAHSSDDRDRQWSGHLSASAEYDYFSIGFGGGMSHQFNDKNTELSFKTNVFLDQWKPIYPIEFTGTQWGNNIYGLNILDQSGALSSGYDNSRFTEFSNKSRNSYSASIGLSQIVSKTIQASLSFDMVYQQGLLSTPYQRVYFKDKANYYLGDLNGINNYTNDSNTTTFQLADDVERLPNNRWKLPIGARVNFYINPKIQVRTFYRYYWDSWDLTAHTLSLEVPLQWIKNLTIYPSYRYYTQTAVKYFAPYEQHLSTSQYYTSDNDLSAFTSHQWGGGIKYSNPLQKIVLFNLLNMKSLELRYQYYSRSNDFNSSIITLSNVWTF